MSVTRSTPARPAVNPRGRQLMILAIAVIIIIWLIRVFAGHQNTYEKLAYGVTAALQSNDVDKVKSFQNAETATTITRGIVGRAADRLAPLGKIKSVKETTPKDAEARTHEFTVDFDKGSIVEKMKVDPDNKIVHFRYEKAAP